jgi:hypothetical protein
MFGQMRSSSRSAPLPPCPCGNTCRCHIRRKGFNVSYYIMMFSLPILSIISIISLAFAFGAFDKPTIQLIEVNGEMCEVHFKQDGITSTGATRGHDEAICKTK